MSGLQREPRVGDKLTYFCEANGATVHWKCEVLKVTPKRVRISHPTLGEISVKPGRLLDQLDLPLDGAHGR